MTWKDLIDTVWPDVEKLWKSAYAAGHARGVAETLAKDNAELSQLLTQLAQAVNERDYYKQACDSLCARAAGGRMPVH
jgi:hypothetical protein